MPTDNLPLETTLFVGRQGELTQIADLLVSPVHRLITLAGPGGIGKTRLAIQAAAKQRSHFADGVYFVALNSISGANLVPSAIVGALQVSFYSSSDPRLQIIHYLHDKHMLLVMDNFEHVLEAADLLIELLQACPGVKCLVTSRERLNLREEWVLTLDGLPFPKAETQEPVEDYGAVQLFVQRARQVQASFALGEHMEAVTTICQQVEGMPLALELAASWMHVMSPRQIAARLDDSLNLLTTSVRNVPERHRSMRAAFEQSWVLLSPAEQQVLTKLSVFRGGFDLEAAEQVAGASLPVLASLADKSMIRLNAAERYDLHELLRQYVADKLAQADEADTANQRHFDYFLRLAESADAHAFGREQIAWFDRMEIELGNLRVAVDWSAQSEMGLRLAGTLSWFFSERGHWREGLEWLGRTLARTLAANPDASPSIRARALYGIAAFIGDKQHASALCDEAYALAQAVGDRLNMAWALSHKGIYGGHNEHDSAEILEASLALFRQIEDAMGLAHTLVRRSWYAMQQGNFAYARLLLDEAGMIAQDEGDRIMMGWVMHESGIITWRQDHDLERARLEFSNGMAYFREARYKIGFNGAFLLLAAVEQELGNIERARTLYQGVLVAMQETYQTDQYLHLVLHGLAWLAWAVGQNEQSERILRAASNFTYVNSANIDEMTKLEEAKAALREYFGEAAFAHLWKAGRAMTRDQAIAYLEYAVRQVTIKPTHQAVRLKTAQADPAADELLTGRELEILHLIADGFNSREIAEQLVLSVGTIRWYLKEIYSKLDAHSRAQAIAHARELNLLA
jgi:predicted ATPase/DNA-binding NarL/FixJ family response regulator